MRDFAAEFCIDLNSDNMRYSFRVFLLNLGFIGDEYKNYRAHLLKHLSGDIAWRHPKDGIAAREKLKQERIAARNERVEAVVQSTEDVGITADEEQNAAVGDCDGVCQDDENEEESMNLSM